MTPRAECHGELKSRDPLPIGMTMLPCKEAWLGLEAVLMLLVGEGPVRQGRAGKEPE